MGNIYFYSAAIIKMACRFLNLIRTGGDGFLKITIKEPPAGAEEEIIVLCHNVNPELMNVLNSIKTPNNMLTVYIDSVVHWINTFDIFYIEAVDRKVFIYCESEVYETKQKLYELEALAMYGFVRISKSVIANIYKIKTFIPSLSGNAEAVLANKERIVISRRYMGNLKKSLRLKMGGKPYGN